MTIPGHNRISTKNGWKSVLLGTSTKSTKKSVGPRGGWTAICKDSQEQLRKAILLNLDSEMKIQNIVCLNYFVFFLIFHHQFVILMRESSR